MSACLWYSVPFASPLTRATDHENLKAARTSSTWKSLSRPIQRPVSAPETSAKCRLLYELTKHILKPEIDVPVKQIGQTCIEMKKRKIYIIMRKNPLRIHLWFYRGQHRRCKQKMNTAAEEIKKKALNYKCNATINRYLTVSINIQLTLQFWRWKEN